MRGAPGPEFHELALSRATHTARTRFGRHAVNVGADSALTMEGLTGYTEPAYAFSGAAGPLDLVSMIDGHSHARFREALSVRAGSPVLVSQREMARRFDLGCGWMAWEAQRTSTFTLRTPEGRVILIADPVSAESTAELIRCLRDMFTRRLEAEGAVVLHAGAIDAGGMGIAFCGPKGAGKSTAVAAMVDAGAAYVTNDRSYLLPRSGGVDLLAWPTTAALGMGTIYQFPGLRRWMERGGGWSYRPQAKLTASATHGRLSRMTTAELAGVSDKLFLTPAEVASSLGSTVVGRTWLECMVLPVLDVSQSTASYEDVSRDELETLLDEQSFTPDDPDHYPDWLDLREQDSEVIAAARSTIVEVARSVPVVRLRYGRLMPGDGRAILDELVRRATAAKGR